MSGASGTSGAPGGSSFQPIPPPGTTLQSALITIQVLTQVVNQLTGQGNGAAARAVALANSANIGLAGVKTRLGSLENILEPWIGYTPTVTPQAGALGAFTVAGRYINVGFTYFMELSLTIVSMGTASGYINIGLPAAAKVEQVFVGRALVAGTMLQGHVIAGADDVTMNSYNNGNPAAAGETLVLAGCYESLGPNG